MVHYPTSIGELLGIIEMKDSQGHETVRLHPLHYRPNEIIGKVPGCSCPQRNEFGSSRIETAYQECGQTYAYS